MKKGFVVLRDFAYGWDFTVFDENDDIIIFETKLEAEEEAYMEDSEYWHELQIVGAYVDDDNHIVAVDDNGNEIIKK